MIGKEAATPLGFELGKTYAGILQIKRESSCCEEDEDRRRLLDKIITAIRNFKMTNTESDQIDRVRALVKELLSRYPEYTGHFQLKCTKQLKLDF